MKLSQAKIKRHSTLQTLQSTSSFKPVFVRTTVEEEEECIPNDPSVIKAEIFKNLDDNTLITQVTVGTHHFTSVCLTNDEKHVIIGTSKGVAIMLNMDTKDVDYTFQLAHASSIVFISATKDNVLITCSKDGCVELWDITSKQPLFSFELKSKITAATLSPDEGYLVVATKDLSIQVWDVARKECLETLKSAHTAVIHALAVTKDNKLIASGSDDKCISLWTFENSNLVHCFKNAHFGGIRAVVFSEDGRTVYSSCANGAINIWDVNKKKNLHRFINAHIQAIKGLIPIKGGRFLLSASGDCNMGVWDTETKAHLHTFKGPNSFGTLVATNDSRCAVVTGEKGAIYFVTLGCQHETLMLKDIHETNIIDMRLTNDSNFIITGSEDGRVRIWDLKTKGMVHEIIKDQAEVWKLEVSPNDKLLAVIYSDSTIDMHSLVDRKLIYSSNDVKIKRGACYITFTRDNTKLISCSHQPHIFIHDVSSSGILDKIENAHQALVSVLDTTNDNKYLASGSKDKSIALWDLATKKLLHRFENAHDATIWTLNLSHNDQYLISGSNDCTIKIWDFAGRRLVHVFQTSHEEWIRGLYVASNDSFFISTDLNGNVEVHNLKTKQRALIYEDFKGGNKLCGAIKKDNKQIIFSRGTSLHELENPFSRLTVQYIDSCHPFSLLRFMPLTSFFSDDSIPHRQNLIKSYPHLKVHPFGWNWFHVVALYAPTKEMISACLDGGIPFSVDLHDKTPLHYLLDNEETEIAGINMIMCKFSQILKASQSPSTLLRLVGDILFQLIELDNQHVISLLNACPLEPDPLFGVSVDGYGDINASFYLSDTMLYSQTAKQNLISEYESKQKISIHMLPFHWNYNATSRTMETLVKTLREITLQGIFETCAISILINYLWAKTRIAFYLLGTLFSVQSILISVYTGLGVNNLGLEIPIFIIALFFFIYELCEMYSAGLRDYLSSIWNYVDCAGALLVPGTLIAVWCGLEEDGVRNWLFSFILSITYIRWVSYFRVFKQTRQLIRMIVEIIQDIRSFATILAFVVFGLSLIFLQFDRDTNYAMHLFNSYRLLFSDYDTDDLSVGRVFYLIIILALVSIVLLNMLITIMGNTFGEVKERSIIVDSKAQLELIAECMKVHHTFNAIFFSRRAYQKLEKKSYLFYVEKKEEQEEVYEKENLEDDIKNLKVSHALQAQQIEEQGRLLEEQTKMIREISHILKKVQARKNNSANNSAEKAL